MTRFDVTTYLASGVGGVLAFFFVAGMAVSLVLYCLTEPDTIGPDSDIHTPCAP